MSRLSTDIGPAEHIFTEENFVLIDAHTRVDFLVLRAKYYLNLLQFDTVRSPKYTENAALCTVSISCYGSFLYRLKGCSRTRCIPLASRSTLVK